VSRQPVGQAIYRRHITALEQIVRRASGVPLHRGANWTHPGTLEPCFEAESDAPERCIWCGKHVALHFGDTEYRCYSRT
jgi:hypothetical protein